MGGYFSWAHFRSHNHTVMTSKGHITIGYGWSLIVDIISLFAILFTLPLDRFKVLWLDSIHREDLHVTYLLLTSSLELENFLILSTLDHFYILWLTLHPHGNLACWGVSHSCQSYGLHHIFFLSISFILDQFQVLWLDPMHMSTLHVYTKWESCWACYLFLALDLQWQITVRCLDYTSLQTTYSFNLPNTHTRSTSTKYNHTLEYKATRRLINWPKLGLENIPTNANLIDIFCPPILPTQHPV